MYPIFRLAKSLLDAHRAGPIDALEIHVSTHICWPWDLDFYFELNNGRMLTLNDINRIPMALRIGLFGLLRENNWNLTVAGASVRYRRRVRMFDKITITSQMIGWDERFLYLEQSMWVRNEATSNVLYRIALVDASGIVNPVLAVAPLGLSGASPDLPGWVKAWIEAEQKRPWPPQVNLSSGHKKK